MKKAQGALEYMLIIAGAIMLAVVILIFLSYMIHEVENEGTNQAHSFINNVKHQATITIPFFLVGGIVALPKLFYTKKHYLFP